MVRAFEVRATKEELVCSLARDLNEKLMRLQDDGWTIISVTPTKCREYHYPKPFESTLFTIIASKDDKKEL